MLNLGDLWFMVDVPCPLLKLCWISGDKGDTCFQCESSGPPGFPGPQGPKGEHGEFFPVFYLSESFG